MSKRVSLRSTRLLLQVAPPASQSWRWARKRRRIRSYVNTRWDLYLGIPPALHSFIWIDSAGDGVPMYCEDEWIRCRRPPKRPLQQCDAGIPAGWWGKCSATVSCPRFVCDCQGLRVGALAFAVANAPAGAQRLSAIGVERFCCSLGHPRWIRCRWSLDSDLLRWTYAHYAMAQCGSGARGAAWVVCDIIDQLRSLFFF